MVVGIVIGVVATVLAGLVLREFDGLPTARDLWRRLADRPVDPTVGDDAAAIERWAAEQDAERERVELKELHAAGKAKVVDVQGSGQWSRVVFLSDGSKLLSYEDLALRNRRAAATRAPLEHRFFAHHPKVGDVVASPLDRRRRR